MWLRIWALILKELYASARDPQTRWVVLFAPPFLLLIYAFAITQDVKNVPVAVYNSDNGQEAKTLLSLFEGSPVFTEIRYVDSLETLREEVNAQHVAMALTIGADFSRKIAQRESASVQLILDGRRSNSAQILLSYSAEIIERYNASLADLNGFNNPARVVPRIWFNPNLKPLWNAVPSLFAVLSGIVGFMVSALAIARERELGTFEQLLVSPLRPLEILAGKTVPALIIALVSAGAMLVFGWLLLDVPFRGSFFLLLVSMVVYLTSIIGIGLFISSLSTTQQQAFIGLFIYMIPAVLLSGYATPVENMPDWLQWVANATPMTHFIVICKGTFLKDVPAAVIWHHTWPLVVIALATLSGGAWLFRRRVG